MKHIPLTKGYVAKVDDADFAWLSQWHWHARVCRKSGNVYAARSETVAPKRERTVLMHRLLISAPDGMLTDHLDGDGLNNQRANLRAVTRSGNMRNKSLHKNNKSGRAGVHWHSRDGRWRAKISVNGRQVDLGSFPDLSDAIAARSAAEKQHGYHANHGRPKQ